MSANDPKRTSGLIQNNSGLPQGLADAFTGRLGGAADRLRAGVVWANTFNRFDPTSPFGGYKESGFGREGGRHGLEAYVKGMPWGG